MILLLCSEFKDCDIRNKPSPHNAFAGCFVVSLWYFCYIFVMSLWYFCDIFVISLWYPCDIFVISLLYHCYIFVISLCYLWISWQNAGCFVIWKERPPSAQPLQTPSHIQRDNKTCKAAMKFSQCVKLPYFIHLTISHPILLWQSEKHTFWSSF